MRSYRPQKLFKSNGLLTHASPRRDTQSLQFSLSSFSHYRVLSSISVPTMGESSMGGALVPTVKSDHFTDSAAETAPFDDEPDKDMTCPICMQIIRDAFLTACGHSFCHVCISTHLRIKSDCPCCASSLTPASIFPNFLLDKVRSFTAFFSFGFGRVLVFGCRESARKFVAFHWNLQLLKNALDSRMAKNASPFELLSRGLNKVSIRARLKMLF